MIHLITIHLQEHVHAQALGFTKTLHLYGWGKNATEAGRNVMAYCLGANLKPERISSAILSQKQDLDGFTFPEQIYGLPTGVGRLAISKSKVSESMINDALKKLDSNHMTTQIGLGMMATSNRRSDTQCLEDERRAAADQAFVDFDFGDDVRVEAANGWNYLVGPGASAWTRTVFVAPRQADGQAVDCPVQVVRFTVSFEVGSVDVEDVCAVDEKGDSVGAGHSQETQAAPAP
ncbi:MAG: hypothetical protein E6Q67_00805 [Roseateles sp.]|nr:MAG: hypothetical protein E6Q67_00805 [Roseateles sp.]